MSYATYDSYKDSGVGWLGEIPSDWDVEESKWLFSCRKEKANKNDEQLTASQKYGVIPQQVFMDLEERRVTVVYLNPEILKHVEKGDFVISMRSFQGGIEYCDYTGSVSSAYVPLIPNNLIFSPFFKYLFKSSRYIEALQSTSNLVRDGQALRYDNFCMIPLPVVPNETQIKIANFLDQKTAQIDQAIALKQQQIEKLGEYKQIVIQNAVTKGLNPNAPMKDSGVEWIGDIPEHWDVKKLKFIAEINKNSLPENTKKNFTFQYVDIGSVSFESGITATEEYTFRNAPSRARRIAKVNDTIISTVRTYLKAIDYIDECKANYIYSTGFAVLSPKDEILPKFLTSFVWSLAFTNQVKDFSKGMSYPAINSTDLGNLFLTVPPNNEQVKIVEHIENLNCKISETTQSYQTQIDRLKEYKNILINQAVTGKIKI